MTYDTSIRVLDPVDPEQMMAAVMRAAGGRSGWARMDDDGISMLYASPDGFIAVHYATAGGRYPAGQAAGPEAYLHVSLINASARRGVRELHEQMRGDIGAWLDQQGAMWAWNIPEEGDAWTSGSGELLVPGHRRWWPRRRV